MSGQQTPGRQLLDQAPAVDRGAPVDPPARGSSQVGPTAAYQWLGLAGQPWSVRLLTAVVFVTAIVTVLVGVQQPADPAAGGLSLIARVGLAAAVAAVAQLARLRFRLGRRTVGLAGGEAAFLIGYALVPPGWVPAATFVGAVAAWAVISVLSDHRPPVEIAHRAASLTLGAAGATAVTGAIARTDTAGLALAVGVPALTSTIAVALLAGCGTYLFVTVTLDVLTLALYREAPPTLIAARILHGRLPIFVGNVLIGLFALIMVGIQPGWLLLVPPAAWLLHRGYRLHLCAEDERRRWPAFAQATRGFGGPSERDVAVAGIRGALEFFSAQRVDISVPLLHGGHRVFTGDCSGVVTEITGRPAGPTPAGTVVSRPLTAAGAPAGELTLWPVPDTPWTERDDLAVAAYGVVLASALHDAATQQRLGSLSAQVSHQAVHDPLTGLRNRAALIADGAELLRSLDGREPVALLLIDLNGFSRVNATLGQRAGDELLRLVGGRLAELAREGELPARLGDDEFALLIPQITVLSDSAAPLTGASSPVPQAMRRAQDLVGRLSAPAEIGGIRLSVEAAAGVVVANAGCFDLAELVRRAEIALGAAKSSEVAVVAFDDSHEVASTDHLAMLAELREALAVDDQIVLALQPAVDLVTGAPTGVEALSRWEHPRRGSLSPIEFIRVVERSELLAPFTRYVLDRSLAAAAAWSAAGMDLPVSVNVAARSLLDRSFPAQVADALRRYGMPSHRLVLEITETLAVSDQPTVDDVVSALRQLGVQLSVDDFGTGYSSLAILERMPVDELKVDRSFVAGMADSPRSAAIVRFAVELGRSLDLRVVAEGVETADQRAALVKLGCATAQGYHFCRPIPADRIVEALRSLSDGAAAARNVVPLRADDAS